MPQSSSWGKLRFAAIADIHGNSDALAAVLADIESQDISRVVNLGDVFSGPLDAAEVAEILRPFDFLTIRGNHDRYLIEQDPQEMAPSDAAAHAQLNSATLDWLRDLSPTARMGQEVFLCHGTPASDEEYWLEHPTDAGGIAMASQTAITARANGINAALILCAHSHIPRAIRLDNGRLIVNPGSVGCPAYADETPVPHIVETGAPDARYAILDRSAAGWSVSFRAVPYENRRMINLAQAAGFTDWAGALTSGRIPRKVASDGVAV